MNHGDRRKRREAIRTVVEGHEALVGDLELEGVEEGGGVVQHRHVGDVHRAHRRREQPRVLEVRGKDESEPRRLGIGFLARGSPTARGRGLSGGFNEVG